MRRREKSYYADWSRLTMERKLSVVIYIFRDFFFLIFIRFFFFWSGEMEEVVIFIYLFFILLTGPRHRPSSKEL